MSRVALDTSAAVPYVMRSHDAHAVTRRLLSGRRAALTGHSLAETYSVLTRLPGDARLSAADAVRLLDANFDQPALLDVKTAASLPSQLAPLGIAGGAVYDAMVALAARDNALPLATRDRRAAATYAAVGAEFELLPG